jgi:hypothetical protein
MAAFVHPPLANIRQIRSQSIPLTNQALAGNVKSPSQKEATMPKNGTLTKARIVEAVKGTNRYPNPRRQLQPQRTLKRIY